MPMGPLKVNQPELVDFISDQLITREDLQKIQGLLKRHKTLEFSPVTGSNLYSSGVGSQATSTVWVRDNVFLAWSFYSTDKDGVGTKKAIAIVNDLASFFLKHAARFDDIVGDEKDAAKSMERPHVRFNGSTFEEMQEYWNHKQNDALGYFMWMRCRLCADGKMRMTGDHLRLLGLMLEYLVKIEYWQDEDSGHWEELPKVSASSIGPVVAGAKEFQKLLAKYEGMIVPCSDGILDTIEENGMAALEAMLPHECTQPGKERDHDAALLFLIYPLNLVNRDMARTILKHVEERLLGKVGIRRFNGDSFWCKDFKSRFGIQGDYTKVTYSDQDIQRRHGFVQPGEESQWCLFDPVISTIYGSLYKETRDGDDLAKQQYHFCRSLGHVTGPNCSQGEWHFPECYCLTDGAWIPNDTCGALWVKANVEVAFKYMDESVALSVDDLKAEFKRFDIHGQGSIALDDLVMVLTKLNEHIPADDLAAMLKSCAPDGKISFESLVDGLFCGTLATPAKGSFNFTGMRPPAQMTADELGEVERVVTDALLELNGEFEGEYYPLPKSQTFPARLGGMTKAEAQVLENEGLLFKSKDHAARGVYATVEKDIGIFINADSHLEITVKPELGEPDVAPARLQRLEASLRERLQQNGYELA